MRVLLLCIFLAGCSPKYVSIPIASCPQPPALTMPELSIERLPEKPETKDALKALMEDHIILQNTLEQCITSLEGYRTP